MDTGGRRPADHSGYVAVDKFLVLGLSKYFSRTLDKCAVRKVVSLELVHHPCRQASEISVDAINARYLGGRTTRLPGDVVVCGPDQRSLQLPNTVRNGIVECRNRLQTNSRRILGGGDTRRS